MAALLAIFYAVDTVLFRREPEWLARDRDPIRIGLEGSANFVLLAAVVGTVLVSGLWKPGITLNVMGMPLPLQNVVRDAALIALALASLALTPKAIRDPQRIPLGADRRSRQDLRGDLRHHDSGAGDSRGRPARRAGLAGAIRGAPGRCRSTTPRLFWVTGLLSAFLDNAPTYLVFFNLAGGDAQALMGPLSGTLAAISMAAVYFGALTYIGNAPNFMIKAIAEDRGVAMPSFFGYLGWAALLMIPLLVLVGRFAL